MKRYGTKRPTSFNLKPETIAKLRAYDGNKTELVQRLLDSFFAGQLEDLDLGKKDRGFGVAP